MAKIKVFKIEIGPAYLWKPRILLVFFLILSLVCSYLIYNNYTVSQTTKYEGLLTQEEALKDELMLKYGQVKSVPLYLAKMNDLANLESEVNQRFPKSEELSLVLIQINQLAEDTNISINSFSPKNLNSITLKGDKKTGNILAETYVLSITANYMNLINFIYQVAKLPRLIEVSNLHMVRVDDKSINAKIDIKIFYSRK